MVASINAKGAPMRILRFYIWKSVLMSTLLVLSVVVAVQVFMELTGQLHQIGSGHYGIWQALCVVLLQMPGDLYQLFPMVGFLGSLLALGRLASNSELIVMRAAGVSKSAVVRIVIGIAILMLIVVTIVGETIAPIFQRQADMLKATSLGQYQSLVGSHTWLLGHNEFVYIGDVESDQRVSDISLMQFDAHRHLQTLSHASYALKSAGKWRLHDIVGTRINGAATTTYKRQLEPLGLTFNPKYQYKTKTSTLQESLLELYQNIIYLRHAGLTSNEYQFALWQRLIQPITTIIMICLGVPFIFGSLRSASTGSRVMVGILMGFSFYMLNQFFGPLTLVYQFPPILAAISPTLLFVIIYFVLMRRIR